MSHAAAPPAPRVTPDRAVVAVVAAVALVLAAVIGAETAPRLALLFAIGLVAGIALYHAAFGFTGGWRRLVEQRRGRAVRAQMLMVGLAAVVIMPLLASDPGLGGALGPVGLSVAVGAALFGCGMQLGGGCGSGTLFTVGGGSARMLVTLVFFCIGSLVGTLHLGWWLNLGPSLGTVALWQVWGVLPGLAVTLAGLAAVAGLTMAVERRAHGALEPAPATAGPLGHRLLHGAWPLVWAAVALAGVNVATLLVAGHTWSVTYGFGLWAAKVAMALGVDVASWPFWTGAVHAQALTSSVLENTVSVMNFGIILGAALAAGLAGRFAPRADLPLGSLLAAVIGGLLMGYGARLSFGCNIGALFSGIASGSLHGWVWFACAFAGSWLGVKARPRFGL